MKTKDTQLIDQGGVSFISGELSQKSCIFNEYKREVGIDGIIEYREAAYKSPGKFIACQIKTGESYFKNKTTVAYKINFNHKYIEYWLKCNLPVILFLVSPSQKEAYWVKISPFEIKKTSKKIIVYVPKANKLSKTTGRDFYCTCFGKLYETNEEFECVKKQMDNIVFVDNKIKISALELFINCLTDHCKQLFFGCQVINDILNYKACMADMKTYSLPKYSFYMEIFSCLNYHSLLTDNFEKEYSEYYEKADLVPIFLKPLSLNGLKFCRFLREQHKLPIHDRFYLGLSCTVTPFIDKNNYLGKSEIDKI